jgi:hypothetical protein
VTDKFLSGSNEMTAYGYASPALARCRLSR